MFIGCDNCDDTSSTGSVVAPLIGGFLADPATQYPSTSIFQNSFNHNFPYVLPCIASSLVALVGAVVGFLWLPESPAWLKSHARRSRLAAARRADHQPREILPSTSISDRVQLIDGGSADLSTSTSLGGGWKSFDDNSIATSNSNGNVSTDGIELVPKTSGWNMQDLPTESGTQISQCRGALPSVQTCFTALPSWLS